MKKMLGFTLLELFVVLSIISFSIWIAIPNWQHFFKRNNAQLLSRQLLASLAFARQNAILHQQPITICPNQDNLHCSDHWEKGWIIYLGETQPTQHSILRTVNNLPHQIKLHWKSFNKKNFIRYQADGTAEGSNGSFYFDNYRLILNRGGRARLEENH